MAGVLISSENVGSLSLLVFVLLVTCAGCQTMQLCDTTNSIDVIVQGCVDGQCGKVYCNNDTFGYPCSPNINVPPPFPNINASLLEDYCVACTTTVEPTTTGEPTASTETTTMSSNTMSAADPATATTRAVTTPVPHVTTPGQSVTTTADTVTTTQDKPSTTKCVNCSYKKITVTIPSGNTPVGPTEDPPALVILAIILVILLVAVIVVFIALVVARVLGWQPMSVYLPCCFKRPARVSKDLNFSSAPTQGTYNPRPGTRIWMRSFSRGQS